MIDRYNYVVTYDHGEQIRLLVSMWHRTEAEKYAMDHDLGSLQTAPVVQSLYAAYKAARMTGKHKGYDFEEWQKHVVECSEYQHVQQISQDDGEQLGE